MAKTCAEVQWSSSSPKVNKTEEMIAVEDMETETAEVAVDMVAAAEDMEIREEAETVVVVAAVAVHSNATNADRQDTLPEIAEIDEVVVVVAAVAVVMIVVVDATIDAMVVATLAEIVGVEVNAAQEEAEKDATRVIPDQDRQVILAKATSKHTITHTPAHKQTKT